MSVREASDFVNRCGWPEESELSSFASLHRVVWFGHSPMISLKPRAWGGNLPDSDPGYGPKPLIVVTFLTEVGEENNQVELKWLSHSFHERGLVDRDQIPRLIWNSREEVTRESDQGRSDQAGSPREPKCLYPCTLQKDFGQKLEIKSPDRNISFLAAPT